VDVLNRPRIRGKYRLTEANIRTVVGLILLRDEEFGPTERINVCRDPKDNKFLEVAVVSRADVVVSEFVSADGLCRGNDRAGPHHGKADASPQRTLRWQGGESNCPGGAGWMTVVPPSLSAGPETGAGQRVGARPPLGGESTDPAQEGPTRTR